MSMKHRTQPRMMQSLLKNRVRVVLLISAVLLFSTLAIGARAWLRAPLETVLVTVTVDGFAPSEVTRAAGSFNLEVSNQSGAEGLTLKLMRDSGELVGEFIIPQGAQQWSEEVSLTAGGYTMTEANHPAWLFHITAQ